MKNIPNGLTILRMALIPFFIACFYIPHSMNLYIAAAVFVIAYATDVLDGYIARKKQIVSNFGKLMDPVADKLLTSSALIMLTAFDMLSPIIAFIIIAREMIISGFRMVWAAEGRVVAADKLGKLKTITQFAAIILILLGNPLFEDWGIPFDRIAMYLAAAISIWSLISYIYKNNKEAKS